MLKFEKFLIDVKSTIKDSLVRLNELSGVDHITLFAVDDAMRLIGTLTDGDIRRALLRDIMPTHSIEHAINKAYSFLSVDDISVSKIREFKKNRIYVVPLLDSDNRLVNIFNFSKRKTILPVDAVLMAGGRGERLRPLTDTTPKPLLPLGDKKIIDYTIDGLYEYGVDSFYVTINYLSGQFIQYFDQLQSEKGIDVVPIKEPKPLGSIGSVSLIENFKHDTVLVMNSDLFTNIDYEDFFDNFVGEGADLSVATIPYNIDVPYAIMDLKDNEVRALREKPTITYYANAGIYLIKREMLDLIPKDTFFHATDLIKTLLESGKKVVRYPIVGYWVDVGRHEDYAKVREFVKHMR